MFYLILTLKVIAKMGYIWGCCALGLFLILAAITEITGSKTWLKKLLGFEVIHKKKSKLEMVDITRKISQ